MTCSLMPGANDTDIEEDLEEDAPSYEKSSTSEALDVVTGMQELEDAIAETKWCDSKAYRQGSHLHSVQIRGIEIKKSHAITQQFQYATSVSSTD